MTVNHLQCRESKLHLSLVASDDFMSDWVLNTPVKDIPTHTFATFRTPLTARAEEDILQSTSYGLKKTAHADVISAAARSHRALTLQHHNARVADLMQIQSWVARLDFPGTHPSWSTDQYKVADHAQNHKDFDSSADQTVTSAQPDSCRFFKPVQAVESRRLMILEECESREDEAHSKFDLMVLLSFIGLHYLWVLTNLML